jgi:hypothetical protein
MTHAKARGSNDLIGKNAVKSMTFMMLNEYEKLRS